MRNLPETTDQTTNLEARASCEHALWVSSLPFSSTRKGARLAARAQPSLTYLRAFA